MKIVSFLKDTLIKLNCYSRCMYVGNFNVRRKTIPRREE